MKIILFKDNFRLETSKHYDYPHNYTLRDVFADKELCPNEFDIYNEKGIELQPDYDRPRGLNELVIIAPKVGKSGSLGKILGAVLGIALLAGAGVALLGAKLGGSLLAKSLGAGLLLHCGGSLIMGKIKMPTVSNSSLENSEKSYSWNVGNLSTSRGVRGVTFGNNVIPEGELLAYYTTGNNVSTNKRTETGQRTVRKKTGKYSYYNYKESYSYEIETDDVKVNSSKSILELLIAAGEGPVNIDIYSIRINGLSISSLQASDPETYVEIRNGTNNQTALGTLLDNVTSTLNIGAEAVTVLKEDRNNIWRNAVTYVTSQPCDRIKITCSANVWYIMDSSSGNHNPAYISYKYRYRVQGADTWTEGIQYTSVGTLLSNTAYYFEIDIPLDGISNSIIELQIVNLSAIVNMDKGTCNESSVTGNLSDYNQFRFTINDIVGYTNDDKAYPNTALLYLRIPASQALNGAMPKVTWKQSRSHIIAYDTNLNRYVEKPASNLAWAIYDCLAQIRLDQYNNTYHNLGINKQQIDYSRFVEFANFCALIDAVGNWYLNKRSSVWDLVQDIATSARAYIGFRYGKIAPFWDCATNMSQIFTAGNIIDGSYTGSYLMPNDRAKIIDVSYEDESHDYDEITARFVLPDTDNEIGMEVTSVKALGLSNITSVKKYAEYFLRRNRFLKQTFTFKADRDSLVSEVGDVIGIQLDVTEWGAGGRIINVDGNSITIDRNVTLTNGNTYSLLVRHSNGVLERRIPDQTSGTYTTLTFNDNPFIIPVNQYDLYSFGILNAETKPFRIESIQADYANTQFQIECIEYNPNVYDETMSTPVIDYDNVNAGISNYMAVSDGQGNLDLTWKASENTSFVQVMVDGKCIGRAKDRVTLSNVGDNSNIQLIPINDYGSPGIAVTTSMSNNFLPPEAPSAPLVEEVVAGTRLIFSVPRGQNIIQLIIYENGGVIVKTPVEGDTAVVTINLTAEQHMLEAVFISTVGLKSAGTSFTVAAGGDFGEPYGIIPLPEIDTLFD